MEKQFSWCNFWKMWHSYQVHVSSFSAFLTGLYDVRGLKNALKWGKEKPRCDLASYPNWVLLLVLIGNKLTTNNKNRGSCSDSCSQVFFSILAHWGNWVPCLPWNCPICRILSTSYRRVVILSICYLKWCFSTNKQNKPLSPSVLSLMSWFPLD